MEVKLRKTSIDAVGNVPWGTHFCQFYQTKEDLIEILVPYFKAGLENNEFCMWITAEPLNAEEAHKALKKKVRSLDDYIKKGQIEILDYNQLYTKQGNFDSDEVLQGWVEKEQNALKKGFDGFRFTGNICWLKKSDWEKFANYEEAANSVIARYRMLAVCSYCLDNCSSSEIIDVVSNHQFAIIKRENEWKTIRSSDRKKAEEARQKSEHRYRTLVEANPYGIQEIDTSGSITYTNPAYQKMLGYTEQELLGISILDLLETESKRDELRDYLSILVKEQPQPTTYYEKNHTKDNRIIDIMVDWNYKRDNEGRVVGFTSVITDITERKKAQEELKRSEETARAFLNATPDSGMLIDREGLVIDLNERMARNLGRTRSDMIGTIIYDYMPPALAEQRKAKGLEAASKREPIRFEDQRENRWFENSVYPILDSKGEVGRFAVFSRDITEHKRAEEALFKEKKFTEDAINAQMDTFFLFEPGTGKAIRWNKTFTDISGYTDGEIARMPAPASYYSPEDLERAAAFTQKVLKEGVGTIELELICKDGRKVPTEYRVSIINDDQGEPKYIISIGRDITERKKAEEELKLHEIRLQALLDLNKMTGDSEQNILEFVREEVIKVTQSQFAFIGFMNDDESVMTTENWSKNTMAQCAVADKPIDFRIAEAGLWGEAVRQRKPVIVNDYNASHLMKKGTPPGHVPIEKFLGIPVFDGEHIVAVAGVANKANDYDESDIRAIESMMNDTWRLLRRKRAEEALQKSEANYRAIFDNANDAIFVHDIDNAKILSANKKACQMYGYTQKEFEKLSVEDISTGVPPYTQKDGLRWFKKAADEGSQLVEWICKDKTGRNFWVEVNLRLAVIEGRKRMFAIVRDITERKDIEAQQKLAGQILERLNRKSVGADLIRDILKLLKKATGLDAVGLRQQEDGDFPYFEVNGFPEEFVKAEGHLCMYNETGELILDSKGRPVLECICGIVLSGRTDPTLPFFTEGGSFWTNSTTELLTCKLQETFQVPIRNRCHQTGYESVALISLRSGDEIVGLLQLNDTRRGCFTEEKVCFFEEIGASIGIGLARIRAEQEVENLARFPSENSSPILRIAKDGMVLFANSAGSELLGNWDCKVGEQAPEHWHEHILKILNSGLSEQLEVVCKNRIFSLVMAPIVDAGYANVYGTDITERKHAEESLRKYQQQLEELVQIRTAELTETNKKLLEEIEGRKRLEKEILNICEREQKRIGQELHDSIGQQFTGISFMTKVLEQKLAEKLPDEATDAAEIKKLVNQAMDQMRSLAKGLHPVDLDAGSLISALQELAATTENLFGIHCTFKYDKLIPIDDTEFATHLYRITQEAITNAIKHGKAKNIRIELAHERDKSVLKVENDGLDFPEESEARGTGMGLQIMDNRADIVGASIDIHKAAEGGTIVTCSFSNKTQ